jgi:hypothetical protein
MLKPTSIPLSIKLASLQIQDLTPMPDCELIWAERKRNDPDSYWRDTKDRIMRYCGHDLLELQSLVRKITGEELSVLIAKRLAIPVNDVKLYWKYGHLGDREWLLAPFPTIDSFPPNVTCILVK